MKTIGVVIATYNGEYFLGEQLRSIRAQTHRPDQIVVVDDCSQDGTKKIIKTFISESPEMFLFIENGENMGSKRSFEIGIANCEADYLALSDQDDVWIPEKLAKVYAALENNPKAQLCFHDLKLMDEKGLPLGKNFWEVSPPDEPLPVLGFSARERLTNFSNPVPGCTMFFAAELKKYILPMPPSKWIGHDWWVSVIGFFFADPIFLREPLAYYRIHHRQSAGIGMTLKMKKEKGRRLPLPLRLERELKRIFKRRRRGSEKQERMQEMSMELLKVIEICEKKNTNPENLTNLERLKNTIQNIVNKKL